MSKYHLVVDNNQSWKKFKIMCILEEVTVKDKLNELIENSVKDA